MKNVDIRLLASRVAYIIVVLLSAGCILIACLGAVSCSTDQVSTEKEQTTVDILKTATEYIKINHPDAAAFLGDDISFTKSYSGKEKQGYTGVTYTGGGWTISIGHAIVPDAAYDIRAEYGAGAIVWVGLSKNGQIKEESYTKTP